MTTYAEEKKQVCDAGRQLLKRGLVEGTWGNCSLRIDQRLMAITPSGRPCEKMKAAYMAEGIVTLAGFHRVFQNIEGVAP